MNPLLKFICIYVTLLVLTAVVLWLVGSFASIPDTDVSSSIALYLIGNAACAGIITSTGEHHG